MSYQREFPKHLRLGVVGVGSHCYRNILPALHHLPVKLEAFCDLNAEQLACTAREYGVARCHGSLTEMIATGGLDAVLICVGPGQHPTLAIEAFRAGLHVWTEKPPSVRAAEVEHMIAARGDRIGAVGFKKGFTQGVAKAREFFVDGRYAPIRSILGVYPMDVPADGATILETRKVTNWLSNGCHPLSFFVAVGGPVRAVTTFRGKEGGGACVLEFESGAIGNLHLASGAQCTQPLEHYMVAGKDAHLTVDDVVRVSLHRGIPFRYGRTAEFSPPGDDSGTVVWAPQNMLGTLENKTEFTHGTYHELLDFCQRALGEKQADNSLANPGSLETALHLMHLYEAALLSDGNRIEITTIC